MLARINLSEELKNIARTERELMRMFNLTYQDLQKIPVWVINVWISDYQKEQTQRIFNQKAKLWQNQSLKLGSR